jgi:RimJ/RimL family protein N-acetyltransferase
MKGRWDAISPFLLPERRALDMSESGAREPKAAETLTARLRLRPLMKRDYPMVTALAASDAVRHNVTVAFLSTSDVGGTFAIEQRSTRTLIGAGGYRPIVGRVGAVELSVCLAEGEWGAGYGTEATQALVDAAFADATLIEVWASIRVTNTRAQRLYEKCGFQPRGTGMARSAAATGSFPVERFVLTRRAWASLKAWGASARDSNGNGPRQTAA